jgi:hypothetical protein
MSLGLTMPQWNALIARRENRWLPANGGQEEVFTSRSGIRMLYCYNPATEEHRYINADTDLVMTNEEARAAMGEV